MTPRATIPGVPGRCEGRAWPPLLFLAVTLLLSLCACDADLNRLVGVKSIAVEELYRRISTGAGPLIIDVRGAGSYEAGHIPGAVSLQSSDLAGYLKNNGISADRVVVIVCDHGIRSRSAAASVASLGFREVRSLEGGMSRWVARGYPVETGSTQTSPPEVLRPPLLRLSRFQQTIETASGLILKPTYMLLSLLLIVFLRGRASRDLVLIRRGLTAFLVGEGVCALNYLAFAGGSEALEVAHGAGMVVMGALVPWGLFLLVDERVVRLADPEAHCVFQRFCEHCWKREAVSCGLLRMFRFAAPVLALVSLMPLSTPLRPVHLILPVFGTDIEWTKTLPVMLVELRLYPILAVILFLLTAWKLRGDKESIRKAEAPFFWAMGAMSFSLFRYFLLQSYRGMPVWADWWEEVTELVTIVGIALFLWIFRRQLGLVRTPAAASSL